MIGVQLNLIPLTAVLDIIILRPGGSEDKNGSSQGSLIHIKCTIQAKQILTTQNMQHRAYV